MNIYLYINDRITINCLILVSMSLFIATDITKGFLSFKSNDYFL